MDYGIICAGFGGQGVLSLGKFIVYGGMECQKEVTWLPSYGPEMRGGTANCTVVISDDEVASPLVSVPDCLIAMNRPSLDKFVADVAKDGLILVNSSLIDVEVERKDVRVYYIKANQLAISSNSPRSANIVMLGAFAATNGYIQKEVFWSVLHHQFEKSKDLENIKKAFDCGVDAVK